mmetsp:Transcript_11145/g.18412  ORF Transcript_11145/g.18412 Transcript_11145/m.18412 type:complete len:222 (+) Transcript_11145:85-750(+)
MARSRLRFHLHLQAQETARRRMGTRRTITTAKSGLTIGKPTIGARTMKSKMRAMQRTKIKGMQRRMKISLIKEMQRKMSQLHQMKRTSHGESEIRRKSRLKSHRCGNRRLLEYRSTNITCEQIREIIACVTFATSTAPPSIAQEVVTTTYVLVASTSSGKRCPKEKRKRTMFQKKMKTSGGMAGEARVSRKAKERAKTKERKARSPRRKSRRRKRVICQRA